MKPSIALSFVFISIFSCVCLFMTQTAHAQEIDNLDVETALICRNVMDREPVDPGTSFPDSVNKLFCFTKIVGAKKITDITHVWHYGNTEMFRIKLPVKASSWRTFSQKTIWPHQTGVWHVDILDAAGNRLEVINFQILKQ